MEPERGMACLASSQLSENLTPTEEKIRRYTLQVVTVTTMDKRMSSPNGESGVACGLLYRILFQIFPKSH